MIDGKCPHEGSTAVCDCFSIAFIELPIRESPTWQPYGYRLSDYQWNTEDEEDNANLRVSVSSV